MKQRKDMRLSERFRRLTLWNKIGLIGAVGSILGIPLAIVLYLLDQEPTQQTKSQPTIQTTVSGQNNPTVIQTGPGTVHITNTQGISADQFQRLAEELGVTKAALNSFFKILEQRAIPPEDLDSTLRTIAQRYKALDEKLKTFASDDPTVQALKKQARQALETGEFDRAEQLLNEASEKDLQAVRQIQKSNEELEAIIQKNKAIVRKRLLSAAASKAEAGDLKYTQLAYAEAAAYYRKAGELVPADKQSILAEYLNEEGIAWFKAGQYTKAQTPLERALGIREKAFSNSNGEIGMMVIMGIWESVHTDVVESLKYLAELYFMQGRYEQAEPLLQRALSIREKASGPAHPAPVVAESLNNLAVFYRAQGQQAEPFIKHGFTSIEKDLGAGHPYVVTMRENYAILLEKMKQADMALSAPE